MRSLFTWNTSGPTGVHSTVDLADALDDALKNSETLRRAVTKLMLVALINGTMTTEDIANSLPEYGEIREA